MANSAGKQQLNENKNDAPTVDRTNVKCNNKHVNKTGTMRPWIIMLQNIEGLVTENSKIKIDYMREYLKEEKEYLLMNFAETWLNDTVKEDVEIEGYRIFRADRQGRIRGAAIYLNNRMEANEICAISNGICELVAIEIPDLQTVNIVVYRPPKTESKDFEIILTKIQDIFRSLKQPDPTIILSGDFNFPFVEWERLEDNSCRWIYKPYANALTDEKKQFENLMDLCSTKCMLQTIEEPTRGKNTLELFFTNEASLITSIGVYKSALSDHDLVEISTNYTVDKQTEMGNTDESEDCDLRNLNFYAKHVNWNSINDDIKLVQWETIYKEKDTLEISKDLEEKILNICMKNFPKKTQIRKNPKGPPKERKTIINRIRMLRRNKDKKSKKKRAKIDKQIEESEAELLKIKRKEKLVHEAKIIDCMKENPKMLFSYVKKQRNRINEIGPFKLNNKYIYDKNEICNLLKIEFTSQFNNKSDKENNQIFNKCNNDDLCDINFGTKDIEEAIKDIDENSSAGPDGIPALFLKKTKESISKPLSILLRKSLDEGKIPNIYKLAYITPIHKGGSKQDPAQYRPVSLTSHIMKIFERVLKKHILKHLVDNNKFNNGQHGFVPGRGTQTQLLSHLNDIFEAYMEGKRLDSVFLDFAKAFDKVDHQILLEKVKKHKISGKIGRWIQEFLKDRKFRVVANGNMSEEEEVTSGVPQGTVLAAILFVIMISDIDDKVKHSIVRSFADDTRLNKKISKEEDKKQMQEDLEVVYGWARDNQMKFNENKFEQMAFGRIENINVDPYKNPNGDVIQVKDTVKDLGVHITNDMLFKEHIDKIANSCRSIMGMLLRTFSTREREPMIKLFNTYIKSKLEYCCVVWSPVQQTLINELENIQKTFTKKIRGLEELDYHQRLKSLGMYSLERRRDRYMIIYGWQQLEGLKENVLKLKTSSRETGRTIIPIKPPCKVEDRKKQLSIMALQAKYNGCSTASQGS